MTICDIDHLHKRFLDIWEWCMRQGFDTRAFTYVEDAFKSEPTIEVTEDAISRNGIKIRLGKRFSDDPRRIMEIVKETVDDAPSVVLTTEQSSMVGEWQITDAYPHNVYCSECHKKFAQTHWAVWEDGTLPRNYCPNCGAKMKGADDDED